MPPSTASASDTGSASQPASQALTAFTDATADLRHAKRLVQLHSRIMPEFQCLELTIQTRGILNELNRSVTSSLQQSLARRKSRLTKASKVYTNATGVPTDESILYQPEPMQIPTAAESADLLSELQTAQTSFLKHHNVVDDEPLEDIYSAYEEILSKDKFKPKA